MKGAYMKKRMVMAFILVLMIVGLHNHGSFASDDINLEINPNVILISSGKILWISPEKGFAFRLVAILSEVNVSLYVQKIDYGEEGCCVKISKTYEIGKDKLGGNLFNISDVRWLDIDSFIFKGDSSYFKISGLNESYQIEKLPYKKGAKMGTTTPISP